jgi:hypothetical protein
VEDWEQFFIEKSRRRADKERLERRRRRRAARFSLIAILVILVGSFAALFMTGLHR